MRHHAGEIDAVRHDIAAAEPAPPALMPAGWGDATRNLSLYFAQDGRPI